MLSFPRLPPPPLPLLLVLLAVPAAAVAIGDRPALAALPLPLLLVTERFDAEDGGSSCAAEAAGDDDDDEVAARRVADEGEGLADVFLRGASSGSTPSVRLDSTCSTTLTGATMPSISAAAAADE